MKILFTEAGWADLEYWIEMDPEILEKVKDLLKDIQRQPFKGLGKPEPLKYDVKGYWSRRINGEHRLVYRIDGKKDEDQKCTVISCRYQYD